MEKNLTYYVERARLLIKTDDTIKNVWQNKTIDLANFLQEWDLAISKLRR